MDLDTDRTDTLKTDETHELISSDKVDGTSVYSRDGDKLGSIHHFMVGKRDGRVRYAVLNFGGLFEGDRFYPLPWDALTYSTDLDGYEIALEKEQLKNSPSYERGSEPTFDADYDRELQGHYQGRY
jgi:PRC-barrel domain protein